MTSSTASPVHTRTATSPDALKRALERLGYTEIGSCPYSWVMTRPEAAALSIPRKGRTVAMVIVEATAQRVGVTTARLCEIGGAQ